MAVWYLEVVRSTYMLCASGTSVCGVPVGMLCRNVRTVGVLLVNVLLVSVLSVCALSVCVLSVCVLCVKG